MIKRRWLPPCRPVALLTRRRKPSTHVVRFPRPFVRLPMAGVALRRRPRIPAGMAALTRHLTVRPRKRKTRLPVIKRRWLPPCRPVALLTRRRKPSTHVVRIPRPFVRLPVAGVTIGRNSHAAPVTLFATQRPVSAVEGKALVAKGGGHPGGRCIGVARNAIGRKASMARRTCGLKVLAMTGHALPRRALEPSLVLQSVARLTSKLGMGL
ncbi:hypothetical protein HRbin09_00257 [bacterium HR09]|nr:hypothetical protein HRbin09_00257 [bacterium HR09]